MAFNDSGVTFADRGASDVHFLSDLKKIQAHDYPRFEAVEHFLGYAKLLEYVTGFDGRLGEMPC